MKINIIINHFFSFRIQIHPMANGHIDLIERAIAHFINIQHSAQSSFAISNNITNSDADRDYNNVMKSQYSSDLWNSLEKGLNAIMDVNGVDDGEEGFLFSWRRWRSVDEPTVFARAGMVAGRQYDVDEVVLGRTMNL